MYLYLKYNLRRGVAPPGFSGPPIGQGARTGPPPLSTCIKTARCPLSATILLSHPSPTLPVARPLGLVMRLPTSVGLAAAEDPGRHAV
jgi:hypothetical protein